MNNSVSYHFSLFSRNELSDLFSLLSLALILGVVPTIFDDKGVTASGSKMRKLLFPIGSSKLSESLISGLILADTNGTFYFYSYY